MALGYEIGTMLKRSSQVWADDTVTVKLDDIEGMDRQYVQIQGKDRAAVADVGRRLGLEDTYIARSYIEQVVKTKSAQPRGEHLAPTVDELVRVPFFLCFVLLSMSFLLSFLPNLLGDASCCWELRDVWPCPCTCHVHPLIL